MSPPRIAAWILVRVLPPEDRDQVLGDLRELFVARCRDEGPWRARRWYRRQAAAVTWRFLLQRIGEIVRGPFVRSRRSRSRPLPVEPREGDGTMGSLLYDLRHILKRLRREPGYTAVVIVILALGIGANTAVFTVLHDVLLAALPYPEPDRLVRLYSTPQQDGDWLDHVAGPAFVEYREMDEMFDGLVAIYTYREVGADLTGGDRPERIQILQVSSGYFRLLGAPPALGRGFRRDEERNDVRRAVLSHALWQRRFDGDPGVIGRSLTMDGVPCTVVGVAPRGFRNPVGGRPDVWVPHDLRPEGRWNSLGNHYLTVIGRLRPGISREQAHARLDAVSTSLQVDAGVDPEDFDTARLVPLHDDLVGDTAPLLWMLTAAVGMVLLLACVNVANLALVRGVARSRETALRAALGAGRGRLIREQVGESLVLGLLGGTAGLAVAWAGVRVLPALAPEGLPRLAELAIDGRTFLFALGISLVTGLAFGIVPGLRGSRLDLDRELREAERGSTADRSSRRLRHGFVVVEIVLAVVLLVGAGLLLRSFAELRRVELGFDPEGVLAFEVHLPESRYPDGEDRAAFQPELHQRLQGLPDVRAAGAVSKLPVQGRYHIWGIQRPDQADELGDDSWYGTDVRVVDGDYFRALGISVLRGRTFDDRERGVITRESTREGTGLSVIVGRRLAEEAFPDRDPVGAPVNLVGYRGRIVGVVDDTAHDATGSVAPTVYVSHRQFAGDRNWGLVQVVAGVRSSDEGLARIRAALHEIDPDLVLHRPRAMVDVAAEARARERFALSLMGAFALLSLALAAAGVYGVLAYVVRRRTREFGIRIALGARTADLRRLVLLQGLAMAAVGVAAGLLVAWGLGRWVRSLLFGVTASDPWTYASSGAVLIAVAGLAAWIPARRATAVDPVRAFRAE